MTQDYRPEVITFKKKVYDEMKTDYEPGFVFMDAQGSKNTLVEWVKFPAGASWPFDTYRWKMICENLAFGIKSEGWTDDWVIDNATGKTIVRHGQSYEEVMIQVSDPAL